MDKSIQWYLTQWGIWQRKGGDGLPHYVSQNYMFMLGNGESKKITLAPEITDDDCLHVDKQIAKLSKRDPQKAAVIFAYYVKNMADEWIAQKLKISRVSVLSIRKQAECWLDCAVLA